MKFLPLLLALLPALVFAATAKKTSYPPTILPDRIVLTWVGDPATTQAVTWRTAASVTKACAQLQPAAEGTLAVPPTSIPARDKPIPVDKDHAAALAHSVEFTGLTPGTLYSYRVGDGTNWSEWFQFRTARRESTPFSFLYLGDPQIDVRSQWSRVWRQAWLAAPQASFALLTGDLINNGERDGEWGEWFEAVGWIGATRPLVVATGSHEYYNSAKAAAGIKERSLSLHWRAQFSLPTNGPAGLDETCYYFDYQDARIIVLNTQEKRDEQLPWLRQLLSGARPRWTILAFHEPIFSGGSSLNSTTIRDNKRLRELWKPVIDTLRIDLVLSGHDHVYGRSGLDGVPTGYPAKREVVNDTVYVVSVSGPKMYKLTAKDWTKRAASGVATYQIITIDGSELRYSAETATGRRFDAFTLRQVPGQRNQLIETMPPSAP